MDDPDLPAVIPPPNPADAGWSYLLLVDLALGVNEDSILDAHHLQHHELVVLLQNPVFVAQLAAMKKELNKDGVTFELKAKAQADQLLETSWKLIHDATTPANVKADLIKSTVRWAGHEKKGGENDSGNKGFSIQINMGGINPAANSTKNVVTLDAET